MVLAPGALSNLRGIALGGSGEIYVADSGAGDNQTSGRVVRIGPDGTVTPVVEGIGNLVASPEGATWIFGLSDVAEQRGALYIVLGIEAWIQTPLLAPNHLVRRDPSGDITTVFDFNTIQHKGQVQQNADAVESNASGVAVAPDGSSWISDAAGNWVARLSAEGKPTTTVEFPLVDGEEGVPTGIAIGPDGDAYVALFRSRGKGGVAHVRADGTYEMVVSGLNAPIDVAFDADGTLYVLEFAADYAPRSGRLLRVEHGGAVTVLLPNLSYPTSLAIDQAGRVYLTEIAAPSGGDAGTGQLVRFDRPGH